MTAAAAAAGLVAMALSPTAARARTVTAPKPAETPSTSLTWSACADPGLEGLECASLQVPLDHKNPAGSQITLALSRVAHTGTTGYQGVLLVNPGGPGGTGRSFAARVANGLPDNLKATYDVIGFDPRGVGGSSPALSCDADYFAPVRPDYVPTTLALESTWRAKAASYAASCGKKYGSLLDHMKTTDAAQDMDDIRVALGQDQINYYGASYGTYLGAVYATTFPTHVRRMVLDSNVKPSGVWYNDNLAQDVAFENNFNALFAWIAKYDSVYHLGTTQQAVRTYFLNLRKQLAQTPAQGVVGGDELIDTYLVAGYIDLGSYWPYLANALAQFKAGNSQPLVDAFNLLGATPDDNGYAVYNAVQCSDTQWPTNWNKWRFDNWALYAFGVQVETWGNAWYNAPCVTWPAKAGKPVKIGSATNIPPILLFQATNDAATPYPGGVEMNKLLTGSRLVVEQGGRTHGVVERGNACIDDKFEAFLKNGTLPANMTNCPRLPEPVPPSAAVNGPASRVAAPDFPPVLGRP
jgi:pimeloyl-ACP methyl ester carboxylesterase